MTQTDELRLIVIKHRWALEEAVYDNYTTKWNRWCNRHLSEYDMPTARRMEEKAFDQAVIKVKELWAAGAQTMFNYLKDAFGSGEEVLNVLKYLIRTQGRPLKSFDIRD